MISLSSSYLWIFILYSTVSFIATSSLLDQGSVCPEITDCPRGAKISCEEDQDCPSDGVCCKSPCGKVCTKLLYKGCQALQVATSRRAKSLGLETRSLRIPRCNKLGDFEPIQCDNEIETSCWCVDESGLELPGTRASSAALVNCTAPSPCADHTCRMFCPYGFALSDDGCPLCRCREPCDNIKCPNSMECHTEEVACSNPPCPPIFSCKKGRSLSNVCPVGDPLRISDTVRPFLCGNDPGKPMCPPLYKCLVQPGNDYGVCCPASLKLQKIGTCPDRKSNVECGMSCTHDLECTSIQKCCDTDECGSSCMNPSNVTACLHQKTLSELLSVSERAGRGYIPQCQENGEFESRQCSRNGLVCWCVNKLGQKLKGSMGAADEVACFRPEELVHAKGRSFTEELNKCPKQECAAICEYGFEHDENGCPTCNCDNPCDGYKCPENEECINVKESCNELFCPSVPVCKPNIFYENPCNVGTPLRDTSSDMPVMCASKSVITSSCPSNYTCSPVRETTDAVCCPNPEENKDDLMMDATDNEERPQSMCEYLHHFSEVMEGTQDGMKLALPTPRCDELGNYEPQQCNELNDDCWCVDHFGTEIPKTRSVGNATTDCKMLRENSECLDMTCRMGCEYGFTIDENTGCPECSCRDPCSNVKCKENQQCQVVDVNCKDRYCPPVPVCLTKKLGQCPYLVPADSSSCDFECNSDLYCNGTKKCCSNGCGTQCVEPLLLTACQHQEILGRHKAHESGIPAGKLFIPRCDEKGNFIPKQCDPSTRECWCVDDNGLEVSKSRTAKELDCKKLINLHQLCPTQVCQEKCEHGYEFDANGCRTCECIDPCKKTRCKEDDQICRLVSIKCTSDFCPPIPMCLPKVENPCQVGQPLMAGVDYVNCGPHFDGCPSSHKCQLSPVGEYGVCCPKPRNVCFEPLDKGRCTDGLSSPDGGYLRYYFNSVTNRCETFNFTGCQGNHNNFLSESICKTVCPVLSECERLREKNERLAQKYKKSTFLPRCEPKTGNWQSVQCLEHVGVCWCVSPQGKPIKGTLIRDEEPKCNFREARHRAQDRSDTDDEAALEEMMMQINLLDSPFDLNIQDKVSLKLQSRCKALGGQCNSKDQFLPTQCDEEYCWCVDEAGNQLPMTNMFKKGNYTCQFHKILQAEVILGFRGEFDISTADIITDRIYQIIRHLNGTIYNDKIQNEVFPGILLIKFVLLGDNKVDISYTLEQMVAHQEFSGLTADISRSRVIHHLSQDLELDYFKKMEHREIVSQPSVFEGNIYHTALTVLAAGSAFIVSIIAIAVLLYRKKKLNLSNQDALPAGTLSSIRPIYVELPNEKDKSIIETIKKENV